MPRSSLVARQMAFRLPLLPLQASHRQQRWPTILALLFLDAPFPRSPGTFVLFGAIELRIARLNLLHSGIGAFPEIAVRLDARGFSFNPGVRIPESPHLLLHSLEQRRNSD